MSRREDIDNAIWGDEDFVDGLSADAKLVYFWSFTNPLCGMAGIYKAPRSTMIAQTSLPLERIEPALDELAEKRFAFYVDGVVWVRTRVRHLRQKTSQIATSIRNDLAKIADDHPLKAMWLTEYARHAWIEIDGLPTLTQPSTERQAVGSLEPNPRASAEGHSTLKGNGKGKGTGNGLRGRGAGRGADAARSGRHIPDVDVRTLAAEHFPDHDPATVLNTIAYLQARRIEPTVERIAEALRDVGQAA